VTADHRFTAAPRDEGGRSCFDAPILAGRLTTMTLCFAPGDVGEVEVPAPGIGIGTIGLGSGHGSASTGSGFGSGGSGLGGRGTRVPRVRQSKAEVKGSLDKDIIRRIIRAHINEVRYCYEQGLARDPALSGKVSIQFTIDTTGSVSAATVADSTLSDEKVASCIAKAVKRWTFPKPTGGGSVVVTYPFVLEPG
jgi:TonB family protein